MRKESIINYSALLFMCCAMLGCGKEESKNTTIYGTVFNSKTHEPVIGAEVEIGYHHSYHTINHYWSEYCRRMSSAVSGYDGQYELCFGEANNPEGYSIVYYISATAEGYKDYYSEAGVAIGSNYRMDINIDPK